MQTRSLTLALLFAATCCSAPAPVPAGSCPTDLLACPAGSFEDCHGEPTDSPPVPCCIAGKGQVHVCARRYGVLVHPPGPCPASCATKLCAVPLDGGAPAVCCMGMLDGGYGACDQAP